MYSFRHAAFTISVANAALLAVILIEYGQDGWTPVMALPAVFVTVSLVALLWLRRTRT